MDSLVVRVMLALSLLLLAAASSSPPADALPDTVDPKDHCSVDTWDGGDGLSFTKELSSKEYVVGGGGKSLHCCARGYRSIEWFKDGRPYPWPGDVSSFIISPESANQTVYSKAASVKDNGNYSCLARNDSHAYMHSVDLNIIDAANYIGTPLPTYVVPDEQLIELGSTARLFCEAFVGRVDLPDAQSEINWSRVGMNSSYLEEQRRFSLRSVARENNQVLGAYLTIRGVKREDLGPYECRVANPVDQVILLKLWLREADLAEPLGYHPKVWRRLAWAAIILLVLAIVATAFRHRLGILALFCRHGLVQPDLHDGKDYDVLILYVEKDANFASEMLNTLKDRSYSCTSSQLTDFESVEDLCDAANKCRRLISIIRPSMIEALHGSVVARTLGGSAFSGHPISALQALDDNECWDAPVLGNLLQLLIRIHPHPVCVTLQALSHSCEEPGLANLMRVAPIIEWHQKRSLWFKNLSLLCLRLPPLRTKSASPSGSVAFMRPGTRNEQGVVVTAVATNCNSSASSKRRSGPYLERSMNDSLEILV